MVGIGNRALKVLACLLMGLASDGHAEEAPVRPKRILVIAGKKSHGPEGNGIHDYGWSAKLIKVMLDNSNVRDLVSVEVATEGWPKENESLEQADSIMVISDGRDGDLFEEAPHLASPERIALISKQVERGAGIVTFHFSTFAPDRYADQILDWVGGYFDWETDGKRNWYSAIQVAETNVALVNPAHEVSRGVHPFSMKEEFYFNLRFHPLAGGVVPLLSVPALPGRDDSGRVVAWARQRASGGRGFGTTCGHFYENWKNDDFRRLVLNGLVWSAGASVPEEGVTSRYYDRAEIDAALGGKTGIEPARFDEKIRVLLVAGNEAHAWHNWKKTTPAIEKLLTRDPRVTVETVPSLESLAEKTLSSFDVIVQNFCNWQDPKALSESAKKAFAGYLEKGGGLVVIHFANGAYHFSLPGAGASDWPEYRRIVRRVWDHQGKGESQSGHDAFGPFEVRPTSVDHPITKNLGPFQVVDELYFRQAGEEPIEPLLLARSQVTGRDEPLAFAYRYGEGEVFQTLLGHSEKTYDVFEAREMIRRAVAWVAKKRVVYRTKEMDPNPTVELPGKEGALGEGKFGKALDARVRCATVDAFAVKEGKPWSMEAWVRLESAKGYNIILSHQTKASADHWELFTEPGTGNVLLYSPKMVPDHVRTTVSVTDGQWHFVSVWLDKDRVRIAVDGQEGASGEVDRGPMQRSKGPFAVGSLCEGGLGCDGMIDDVRVSRIDRTKSPVPGEPARVDDETIALWSLDAATDKGQVEDASPGKTHLTLRTAAEVASAAPPAIDPHYAEGAIGFNWKENDSADGRWNQTEIGPFLASVVPLPSGEMIAKGLSIAVGANREATVCYDTKTMELRAGWRDGFLQFDPMRHGLIAPPRRVGSLLFQTKGGGRGEPIRYLGMYQHEDKLVLEGELGSVKVREHPWAFATGIGPVIVRTIQFDRHDEPLLFPFLKSEFPFETTSDPTVVRNKSVCLAIDGAAFWKIDPSESDRAMLRIEPAAEAREVRVALFPGGADAAAIASWKGVPAASITSLMDAGPPHWPAVVKTTIRSSTAEQAYVVDDLPLPHGNPYRALCFPGGHDFLPDGRVAVCMVHGDVWMGEGAEGASGELRWRRYATGLHQPLGLKVRDGRVFVLGRDRITELVDRNGDGEADHYVSHFDDYESSTGGHDYVTCLETDSEGRFVFLSATQGLIRIRADGTGMDVVARGFRNPNGLGVGPGDWITVSPQEGEWTPSSSIIRIREGAFYGFPTRGVPPNQPVEQPLCWIPRLMDNSSGGQLWVDSSPFGPLDHRRLHFSFGQCRVLLSLTEQVGEEWQGGVATLPLEFRSGISRGRISPMDGQVYVTGLKGWVTSAVDDGCLNRIRYTGRPFCFPTDIVSYENGLLVRFAAPLDKETAGDPDRYGISAWNYRAGPQYGSPDIDPRDPKREGREEWTVESATVTEDRRGVFLEIPSLKPVMQLSIGIRVADEQKEPVSVTVAYTLHRLGAKRMPAESLTRRARPGVLPEEIKARIKPGFAWEFKQGDRSRWLVTRSLAWCVPTGSPPAFGLKGGPFEARGEGYLDVPQPGMYQFSLAGNGTSRVEINGKQVEASGARAMVSLHKGFNRIRVDHRWDGSGDATFRLMWEGEFFPNEPVPPWGTKHDEGTVPTRDKELVRGYTLVTERRCFRCHEGSGRPTGEEGPSLAGIGSRVRLAWMKEWLLDPSSVRPSATMPDLFHGESSDEATASDIVAYLATLRDETEKRESPSADAASDLAADGGDRFEDLGCIACHTVEKTDSLGHDRLSLARIGDKYEWGALERFLAEPASHFPSTRMPDFQLSPVEGASLVAYLRDVSETATGPSVRGDAVRGAKAFVSLGCAQCHRTGPEPTRGPASPPWAMGEVAEKGCLAEKPTGRSAGYRWNQEDRRALAMFWREGVGTELSLVEKTQWTMSKLRCHACHSVDGAVGLRGEIIQEESDRGLPPETYPDLTWGGEKLQPAYLRDLMGGKLPQRARPWLKGRMPAFAHDADLLSAGLAAGHGLPVEQPEVAEDRSLVDVGRKLTGLSTGLDCKQCHAIGAEQPAGDERTQLALGINFAQVKDRLRHEHYLRFVLDPPRYDIGTRMPKLSLDGRSTRVRDVLEGDARRQFEAIWQYIQSLPLEETRAAAR